MSSIRDMERAWEERWEEYRIENPNALLCDRCRRPYAYPESYFGISGTTHPEPNEKGRRHLRLWKTVRWLLGFHAFQVRMP